MMNNYLSNACFKDDVGNTFTKEYISIPDLSTVKGNFDYDFLRFLQSPSDGFYLYGYYDKKNGIFKMGQSGTPFKRITQHAMNSHCYGNSDLDQISVVWSKRPFLKPTRLETSIEEEMIELFQMHYPEAKRLRSEFFTDVSCEDSMEFCKNFFYHYRDQQADYSEELFRFSIKLTR
jgi:hypothetical protein